MAHAAGLVGHISMLVDLWGTTKAPVVMRKACLLQSPYSPSVHQVRVRISTLMDMFDNVDCKTASLSSHMGHWEPCVMMRGSSYGCGHQLVKIVLICPAMRPLLHSMP